MYKVEYYKEDEKDKPNISEPIRLKKHPNNKHLRKRFEFIKKLIDDTWNIKSVTVDVEDLKRVPKDRSIHFLNDFSYDVNRPNYNRKTMTFSTKIDGHALYIQEIINCPWMLDVDKEIDAKEADKIVSYATSIIEKFETVKTRRELKRLFDEFDLVCYYIETIYNKLGCEDIKKPIVK